MVLTNTDFISGKEIETIGIVRGSYIQTKHIGLDIVNGLKSIIGGELKGYSQMVNEARDFATERMVKEAQEKGADAVINIRYTTSTVLQGASEVLAYGTAVKFK